MSDLIRLRDLPGVQQVAELCLNPRLWDYPTSAHTQEKVDAVSISLFGITVWQTRWPATYVDEADEYEDGEEAEDDDSDADVDDDADGEAEADHEEEYEENFRAVSLPWPASRPFWEAIGWDMTDEKGGELICAHLFARQIIATAGGLVPGAILTPNGNGKAAYDWDGRLIEREKRWEESLEEDAKRFLLERGRHDRS